MMAALLAAAGACGSDPPSTVPTTPTGGSGGRGGSAGGRGGTTGGSQGGTTGGTTGGSAGGTTGGSAAGTGGSTGGSAGGSAGGTTGGSAGGTTGGSAGGTGGSAGGAGGSSTDGPPAEMPPSTTDWMGYPGLRDLSQVNKSPGCGMAPAQTGTAWTGYNTAVPIPPNHQGPGGDGMRRYFVKLPANYDQNKVYKVIIGGSSCVPNTTSPMPIDYTNVTTPTGGVIQISPIVEPGVMQEGSYICYDDKDPNSIEFGLVEKMIQEVGDKFCIDKNKVFSQGHSSGGWYSNMIGCKQGSQFIRAISSNGGGIPDDAAARPVCPDLPTPGLWIHPTGDTEQPNATRRAIGRALRVNKCMGAGPEGDTMAWQTAPYDPYTMGGGVGCRKYRCPDAFPVIFCQPPGGHGLVSWHPQAAWTFFNSLP
jgi:hypothetical protein